MPTTPLRQRPAWKALEQHHSEISGRHLRELFAADPGRGERLTAEAAGLYLDYSKNRVTDETLGLLLQLAEESGVAERRDAMMRGEAINVSEHRAVLHVALRMPKGSSLVVEGVDVVSPGARGAGPDGGLRGAHPLRGVEGLHRQGHPEHRQRRDRRLGPRAGHGLRGAALLLPAGPDVPLRVQRGLHRFRRGDPGPGRRRDAVHHLLQDLRHPGDADQRPFRPGLGGGRARQRGRGGQAFRRGLHQRGAGLGIRHRHREHVRLLGLGRRPVLDGFRDRPVHHGGDRSGELRRNAGRLPRDGRALPHRPVQREPPGPDGPAGRVVRRLLRCADLRRDALRAVPEAVPCLSAAADHGVQRQAGHPGRRRSRLPDRARSSGGSPGPTGSTASTS